MNIAFWILQCVLALLCIPGGAFKIAKFEDLKKGVHSMRSTPKGLWFFFGAFEVIAGICLLLPASTSFAAIAIAIESVLISLLYTKFADKAPRNFTIAMTIIALVIVYGRLSLSPY